MSARKGSTPPLSDYASEVRSLAAGMLSAAGEAPLDVPEAAIIRARASGMSASAAAADIVAAVRIRRGERGPYDPQEQRVCEHLATLIPGIGCGMDPVGFLIASHSALSERVRRLRERLEANGIASDDVG